MSVGTPGFGVAASRTEETGGVFLDGVLSGVRPKRAG